MCWQECTQKSHLYEPPPSFPCPPAQTRPPPNFTLNFRGIHLAPTCSKELADFLTQHQQPAATAAGTNKTAGGKGQQRKPFSPFLATTLMLMSELSHGDDSSHTPYFNTLPEATTCLLNWTTEEQQLLAGEGHWEIFTAGLLYGLFPVCISAW